MARPREFDETVALRQATELFWEKGYERTSLDDLLEVMGIQKGSFYNAFGGKKELYLRCLESYHTEVMRSEDSTIGEVIRAIGEGPDALKAFMAGHLEALATGDPHACCFVAAASQEHRGRDEGVMDVTKMGVEAAMEALAAAFAKAQAAGTIPEGANPRDMAVLFVTMGYGSQVLASAGVPKEALLSSWGSMLGMMGGSPVPSPESQS